MNEMEMMQLSRLLNGMVGEPPRHVTVGAVRRKLLMRRLIAGVTATAAAAFAVSAGLVISAHALGKHPVTNARPGPAEPRYYFEEGFGPHGGPTQDVVRSTSTGNVTARRSCPGSPQILLGSIAAADRETFFMACLQFGHQGHLTGTRLYRFALTRSGRVTGFRPVPGGNLKGLRGGGLAASPDGTELAVAVEPARTPNYDLFQFSDIIVINTGTGKHAVWHGARPHSGTRFIFWDLSFARNGQELAAFGWAGCPKTPTVRTCRTPGEMVAVSHPAAGGRLGAGRVLFTRSSLTPDRHAWIGDAFISPDGTTAIAVTSTRTASTIMRVSTATGKPSGVLARGPVNLAIRPDPSGQFVLVTLQTLKRHFFGWINHGKLAPLEPTDQIVDFAAW